MSHSKLNAIERRWPFDLELEIRLLAVIRLSQKRALRLRTSEERLSDPLLNCLKIQYAELLTAKRRAEA